MTAGPAPITVDVVFPCLNEEGALPWVLSRMPEGYRAIVVDNGSSDRSAEVAREHGALVVTGQYRLGDVRHITASSQRIRSELGWTPSVSFEEGMREFATAPLRAAVQ